MPYVPCARLAHPNTRPLEVVAEALVVFCEPAELELAHGLLVRPRRHPGGPEPSPVTTFEASKSRCAQPPRAKEANAYIRALYTRHITA